MAVAAGKGSLSDTLAYAKRWDAQTPQVSAYIKAIAGTSVVGSPAWGGELVNPNTMATEFVELLTPQTIIGRVPGFRNVPFNIPIITQTGGSTFTWVGEGASKGVGELAFTRTTIGYHKVAGIVVLTDELVRQSTPAAEEVVRRDMVEQCAKFLDEAFIQVAKTANTGVNPASITNGVTSPAASGTTLSDLQYDLNVALATFDTAGVSTDGLVIVTTPALARGISMLTNPLGQAPTGFNVSPTGGTLLGYPVIVSSSVDAGTIVIFKPSEIFLADDGRVTLDASNQATLDMDGGSPATATFSLWQNNCVGIRAERWITWLKRRATGVVAVIDTASYGPAVGSP
jgi:HK97 family phage major capsid protein